MFAKNQILYSPGGLALKTNLRGPLPGRVWLLFFFILLIIFNIFIKESTGIGWISRSVALDMPVRGSRILGFSKFRETKSKKKFILQEEQRKRNFE